MKNRTMVPHYHYYWPRLHLTLKLYNKPQNGNRHTNNKNENVKLSAVEKIFWIANLNELTEKH